MKNIFLLLLMVVLMVGVVQAQSSPSFTGVTPANNSLATAPFTFSINVSVSGFNWTNAFLNFSNNITYRNMSIDFISNMTTLSMVGSPANAQHGLFINKNVSTANLTINYVLTGGSSTNVSLNGFVLGVISAGTSVTFSDVQSKVLFGNNNITFNKFTGGGSTLIVTNTTLRHTESDYEFGFPFTLGNEYYNYTFVVEQGVLRNSTGRRYLTVFTNSSPVVSLLESFPTSPATYSAGNYSFNATWTDVDNDIDKVFMQHNFFGGFTNYPTTNVSSRYSYVTSGIAVGNYSWLQGANDSQGNNVPSPVQSYRVVPAQSVIKLFLNGQESDIPASIGQRINFTGKKVFGVGTLEMFINGTLVDTDLTTTYFNQSFSANGTYPVLLRLNDSQNFSGMSVEYNVIVPPFEFKESTIFTTAVCPNTTLPDTLIFMFIGLFLLLLLLVNMLTIRIPVLNLMVGLGLVLYSFTMYGCSVSMGLIVFVIGLMIMASTLLVSK